MTATPRLRLAVSLDAGADFALAHEQALRYERAGIDVILVPEAYGIDAVSVLGYLAGVTERVELMSGILPIFSRTPALLAMTAAGLDMASGGRFSLGLGASGPQVIEGWHGVPFNAPVGRTRELLEICRAVWRRDVVTHDGPHYPLPLPGDRGSGLGKPLKLVHRPVRPRIPIYLAALGPANVALAAEAAEGWLPFLYVPERAHLVWGEPLAKGQAKRAAELPPLEVVAGGPFAVGPDVTHLRELDRGHHTMYVGGMGSKESNFYNRVVSQYGWEAEAATVQDLYLAGDRKAAAAALPAELLEGTSLIGDEGYVRDRLRAYLDSGVTVLQVTPVGADPYADVARLRGLVDAL